MATKILVHDGSGENYVDQTALSQTSETYTRSGSYQSQSADLELAAGAGKSTGHAYLAPSMWNVSGDSLTKTANTIGGAIVAYSITGTKSTTYPAGALVAEISDGVTQADGAVVANLGGDSATTTAEAAFKVMSDNSTAASGFDFALDCQDAAHDGYQPVDSAFYNKGILRLTEDVCLLVGTAAPTNGASGTGNGVAGPGSIHLNSSDGKVRTNTNTKASPTWTVAGSQS